MDDYCLSINSFVLFFCEVEGANNFRGRKTLVGGVAASRLKSTWLAVEVPPICCCFVVP